MPEPGRGSRYRYRTRALVGAWQPTLDAAWDDAIKAGQARAEANGTLHWVIRGEIERSGPDEAPDFAVPGAQSD